MADVEAMQWLPEDNDDREAWQVVEWLRQHNVDFRTEGHGARCLLVIPSPDGDEAAARGDWIIRGVTGKFFARGTDFWSKPPRSRPAPAYPDIRIESDGIPWKTKITVDGVMVPCTKIVWTANAETDSTRCELEVPRVGMSAQVRDLVARYVDHKVSTPWFWWHCPCGVQMGHPSIEACASGFHNPDYHAADCRHVPATPATVLPVSTED